MDHKVVGTTIQNGLSMQGHFITDHFIQTQLKRCSKNLKEKFNTKFKEAVRKLL